MPLVRGTLVNIGDIFFGLLPPVMAIGTAALVVAEFTPIFTWVSLPIEAPPLDHRGHVAVNAISAGSPPDLA